MNEEYIDYITSHFTDDIYGRIITKKEPPRRLNVAMLNYLLKILYKKFKKDEIHSNRMA